MRRAEDMILISVDDHIAEPADMFDQHVPARYRDRAPRVETDEERRLRMIKEQLRFNQEVRNELR